MNRFTRFFPSLRRLALRERAFRVIATDRAPSAGNTTTQHPGV